MDSQAQLAALNDKMERILAHLEAKDSKEFKEAQLRYMQDSLLLSKHTMSWARLSAISVTLLYFAIMYYYNFLR